MGPACGSERTSSLTPQRHEDGEEDGGGVVEQVTGARRPTGSAQLPVPAHSVTQRTHGDVVLRMADLHAGMHTHVHTLSRTTKNLPKFKKKIAFFSYFTFISTLSCLILFIFEM